MISDSRIIYVSWSLTKNHIEAPSKVAEYRYSGRPYDSSISQRGCINQGFHRKDTDGRNLNWMIARHDLCRFAACQVGGLTCQWKHTCAEDKVVLMMKLFTQALPLLLLCTYHTHPFTLSSVRPCNARVIPLLE